MKNISSILQFVDSTRFMAISILNLVNNLYQEIHRIRCKSDAMIKNVKHVELNIRIATSFFNTQILKII